VNRIADLFECYTVGTGLQFTPDSSDQAWNDEWALRWEDWGVTCDVSGRLPFNEIQSMAARAWLVDGEIFILLDPKSNKVQLIEGHKIETPPDLKDKEGVIVDDGVQIDKGGRVLGYHHKDVGFLRADDVVHIFEPGRPGQYRGLPFLYPVLNDLHDLDDLQILEMKAAKDAAEISYALVTQSGEMPAEKLRQSRFSIAQPLSTGATAADSDERSKFIRDTIGGRAIALKTGEDIKSFTSGRPTVTTQQFWDYMTAKICAGVGISKLLVYPGSVQGTVARAELDIAAAFFRAKSSILQHHFGRIYEWETALANVTTRDKPADYRRYRTSPPRAVNVDVGRQTLAQLASLKAGTTTYQQIYAEMGLDWRNGLRQRADEAKYINDLAQERDIPPDQVSQVIVVPDATTTTSQEQEPA
jgi:capsid protein